MPVTFTPSTYQAYSWVTRSPSASVGVPGSHVKVVASLLEDPVVLAIPGAKNAAQARANAGALSHAGRA
ncbi:MAG: hypothetical protein Q8P41_14080 [Pseudomonadota bacterium]|nr:hypothetical protein [Pseudomonadota bacterium]